MDDPAHAADKLTALLGDDIEAPDQGSHHIHLSPLIPGLRLQLTESCSETFEIFSHDFPSSNLGFVDSNAQEVEVSIAGKEYTIRQSPGLLSSNRKEGTTGSGKSAEIKTNRSNSRSTPRQSYGKSRLYSLSGSLLRRTSSSIPASWIADPLSWN
jgi:hypothetical protein